MTKIETYVEFPCGYKFSHIVNPGWTGEYTGNIEYPIECPLHGKKCKREKK